MNLPVRRDLATNLLHFPRTMDDLLQNIWSMTPLSTIESWKPSLDIKETPEDFRIKIELPGIDPDDIDVQVGTDNLTVRGEKKAEEKKEGENWHVVERSFGSFVRTIDFPSHVRADGVIAETKDGILMLTVPKATDDQPHKVKIKKS